MTYSPGLELTRKKHGSSLEDDIDLEVDSDSYEEGFRSPVTEKNKIGNGNDFDDVEGVYLIACAFARCWRTHALCSLWRNLSLMVARSSSGAALKSRTFG